ncbi:ORF6N domain-containing protein [Cytobacillus oceanisediminis]|uniref:ORF6N domain-containing protein n=1 Tax=Cytobacillus oceanisediminis TaxID=665099 RepID=UPI00207A3D80|nr:ORF6N domain-containing protein [Cytobacillus oceanisediminis]MBY0157305.1 ORF6N domain-containing protein [Cytobacillus firmus]USK46247.1 ORF6N domain-containing protein [Cytobacillus oceanisediminis]
MNHLQPISQGGKRVLTTIQLAEVFGTEAKIINRNFQRNADRYVQGKHYFALSGEELREFKGSRQFDDSLKFTSILYLWTEKGAWLHAKSLNTDQAWDAYEMLVDEYYTIKENVVPLSKDQALVTVLRTTADLVEDTQTIKAEQQEIRKLMHEIDHKVEEQITLTSGEQRRLQKGIAKKVYEMESDPKVRPRLFRELHREIKDRFGVASYKDVKRKELQSALCYIENWIPRKVS